MLNCKKKKDKGKKLTPYQQWQEDNQHKYMEIVPTTPSDKVSVRLREAGLAHTQTNKRVWIDEKRYYFERDRFKEKI